MPGGEDHVVTVTATRAAADGHLAAWPCDGGALLSRTVAFDPGRDAANTTIVTGGELCVRPSAAVDVIVDVVGSFVGATHHDVRLVDTRRSGPTRSTGDRVELPALDGQVAFVNVTATGSTSDGYATVHPCDEAPRTSNVNVRVGADVANLALVDPTRRSCVTIGGGSTHLVVDLVAVVA
jgi:autotransporter family porin